jgi:hypothetical protein
MGSLSLTSLHNFSEPAGKVCTVVETNRDCFLMIPSNSFDGKTSEIDAVIITAHEATEHLTAKFTISSTVPGE